MNFNGLEHARSEVLCKKVTGMNVFRN